MTEHYARVGDTVRLELPYSEVCMHMKIAGKVHDVKILPTMAQVFRADDTPLSFPITHGEAGLYRATEPGTFRYTPATDRPEEIQP